MKFTKCLAKDLNIAVLNHMQDDFTYEVVDDIILPLLPGEEEEPVFMGNVNPQIITEDVDGVLKHYLKYT